MCVSLYLCVHVTTCLWVCGSVGLWVLCICVSVRQRVFVSVYVPMSVSVRMSVFMQLQYQNSRRVCLEKRFRPHLHPLEDSRRAFAHRYGLYTCMYTPLPRGLNMYVQPA